MVHQNMLHSAFTMLLNAITDDDVLTTTTCLIKPPLAITKAALRIDAVHLFVCSSVCLSPKCVQKTRFSEKRNDLC